MRVLSRVFEARDMFVVRLLEDQAEIMESKKLWLTFLKNRSSIDQELQLTVKQKRATDGHAYRITLNVTTICITCYSTNYCILTWHSKFQFCLSLHRHLANMLPSSTSSTVGRWSCKSTASTNLRRSQQTPLERHHNKM